MVSTTASLLRLFLLDFILENFKFKGVIEDSETFHIELEELNNPPSEWEGVNHPLHESITKLWELYKGWVHLASESSDGEELTDMLFFYNQLIEIVNLYYVFTHKNKQDKKV